MIYSFGRKQSSFLKSSPGLAESFWSVCVAYRFFDQAILWVIHGFIEILQKYMLVIILLFNLNKFKIWNSILSLVLDPFFFLCLLEFENFFINIYNILIWIRFILTLIMIASELKFQIRRFFIHLTILLRVPDSSQINKSKFIIILIS